MFAIDQSKCLKVGDCVKACPIDIIVKNGDGSYMVGEDCTDCAACEPACDAKAIREVN
ncbi:MAG TPA: 4Fe-4S dicluster domain-containing protein [Candidatus Acidoferrales bacterium]|jgi:MinD superfamily P-loop ATPase|nr:4Fe-4S dicluster domain-containing protein [Candidatus Acidoferrales bacterium]